MSNQIMSANDFMSWYKKNEGRVELVAESNFGLYKKSGLEPIEKDGKLMFFIKDVYLREKEGEFLCEKEIENIEFTKNEIIINYVEKKFLPRDVISIFVKQSPLDFLMGE